MSFELDASTSVTFTGDRYLHAYMAHSFAGSPPPPLFLDAEARQFSCFMLLVGRIGANQTFEPKAATLCSNKDTMRSDHTANRTFSPL